MTFQAMALSSSLKRSLMLALHSQIGLPGLRSPVGTNCWNSVRTVGGNMYMSSALWNFLSENSIKHQKTAPHMPQQNGRAEHFNCMLLDKSEAMQQHACLPPTFWQDAIKTSLHIYNRQPMCHLNWYSLIQLWNGTKPDVSYFRTFGCWAYVFIPKDRQANKLTPKSEDMMFIGYEPGTKDYRFWSKIRRMVVISSTAVFDEFDFLNCPREKL